MAGTTRLAVALNGYGLSHRGPEGVEREVLPWHEMLLIAETAEETGYESIFTPEIAAREAFSTLTGFAAATRDILLATGVVPLRARSAPTLAMAAATVQDASDGRFLLGVGSRETIRDTRERVLAVRELLRGGRTEVDGQPVGPIHLPDLDADPAPLYLAALGPRMTELAGEVADGVVLNWCTPERVAEARAQVRRGAERAGRPPSGVTVAVYVRACLGHDEEHALAALGEVAGQYGAMDRYRRQLDAMGLGREAGSAAAAWESGRPTEVPRSLLRALCVWGTREEALDRLAAYKQAGADLVVVYPVPAQEAVSSTMGTILAAAPDPAVEA
jgi:alkanesulfonate monooxygenase SsuD/methylene tetrahydromethanopterin reductase-like flavin-dependent oxidoreductase (luciferase family)